MAIFYLNNASTSTDFNLGNYQNDSLEHYIPAANTITSKLITQADTTWYTEYYYYDNAIQQISWPTGNYTINLNVTTAPGKEFLVKFKIHRLDPVGLTVVDSSVYSTEQDISDGTGVYTFNFNTFTFADGATTDIFALEMAYYNGNLHGDQSFQWTEGASSSVDTPINLPLNLTLLTAYNGTIEDVTNAPPYYEGDTVNIKATPDTKYDLDYWTATGDWTDTDISTNINDITAKETFITMPGEDVSLNASFKIAYYLVDMVVDDIGGAVSDVTDSSPYAKDTIIDISATPDTGWNFQSWSATADLFYEHSSFETDLDGWVNDTGNSTNWARNEGSTGSSNTGPEQAFEGSFYIYYEASTDSSDTGRVSIIEKDLTNPLTATVSFAYSMYGADMGTLELRGYNGSTWDTLWTKTGNQGLGWFQASANLTNHSRLQFYYTMNSGYEGDVAVDDIFIKETIDNTAAIGNTTSANTTYTVPQGDSIVTGSFVQYAFNTHMESSYGGSTYDTTDAPPYVSGDTITVNAVPETGFSFDYWTATGYYSETDYTVNFGDSTAPATTFLMPEEDVILKGYFIYSGDLYQVTMNGSILSAEFGAEHRGFVISLYPHDVPSETPANSDYEIVVDETGTFNPGNFSLIASNLYYGVTYYARSFAARFNGMAGVYGYSGEISFMTRNTGSSEASITIDTQGSGREAVTEKFLIFRGRFRP